MSVLPKHSSKSSRVILNLSKTGSNGLFTTAYYIDWVLWYFLRYPLIYFDANVDFPLPEGPEMYTKSYLGGIAGKRLVPSKGAFFLGFVFVEVYTLLPLIIGDKTSLFFSFLFLSRNHCFYTRLEKSISLHSLCFERAQNISLWAINVSIFFSIQFHPK